MNNYLIGLSVMHLVLMLGYWMFLRKERQYTTVRYYLLGTIALALIIPALRLPKLFVGDAPLTMAYTETVVTSHVAAAPVEKLSFRTTEMLIAAYGIISLFFLFKFFASLRYLLILANRNRYQKTDSCRVYRVHGIPGSFSFFNWIFISDDIETDSQAYHIMVAHEKAHSSLAHTYDLIFIGLFRALFWWLPSAWYLNMEIKKVHEYQADACVLQTYSTDQYSSILIGATLNINGMGPVSSFNEGSILKRLKVMRQQTKNVSLWRLVALAALCVVLVIGFGCTEDKGANITEGSKQSEEEIFTIVEKMPEYKGGPDAFYKDVNKEIKYPAEAREKGIEGRVDVQFVIDKDGTISQAKAVNGIGSGCDQEAERALKGVSFIPATQNGKPVHVRYMLPITFKLDRSDNKKPQGVIVLEPLQQVNAKLKVDANYSDGEWKGKVLDEEGEALPGVNILIEETSKGTTSDLNGAFTLKAEEKQNLVLSFVGYDFAKVSGQ
ncbi:MAG: TonB family protein [Chryseolinea sp.]